MNVRGRKWREAGEDCIMRSFMSRRKRWVGHVARTGEEKCIRNCGCRNLKGRCNSQDLDVDGRIITIMDIG
jgi:hypothetical protein